MQTFERTLYPSRRKRLKSLLICSFFVLVGLFMLKSSSFQGWPVIVFFGLCVVVNGVTLVPGSSYLRLTTRGFEVRNLFRTHTETWSHIDSFVAYANRTSRTRLVGFRFVVGQVVSPTTEVARRAARRIGGVDGALPDTYGMSAEDLAALMNEYLNRSRRT